MGLVMQAHYDSPKKYT